MKTILVVFDGRNLSAGAMDFVRVINKKSHVQAICVVLSSLNRAALGANGYYMEPYIADIITDEAEKIAESIQRFKDMCTGENIVYKIHNDSGADDPLEILKKETRFADVVVIGSEVFYREANTRELNNNLKYILHNSKCPVVLVPENFQFPENIILTYDDSESSIYAIKQFAYLFPELTDLPTRLVYADENKGEIPERQYVEQELQLHFKNITLQKLDIDPQKYFDIWLAAIKKPLVVAGSYGRSELSEIFEKNFLNKIITEHKCPLFIAHK